jgi:hypothetical protein
MKICEICGAQLGDTDTVCPVCGVNVGTNTETDNTAKDASGSMYTLKQEQPGTGQPTAGASYGTDGTQPGYGQGSYGPGSYDQPAYSQTPVMPHKATNVTAIVLIAVAAVAILGVAVWFFFLRSTSGVNTPESVIQTYLEAMNEGDVDKMLSLVPDGTYSDDEKEELESTMELFASFNLQITDISISGKTAMTSDEVADLKEETGANITAGYYVDYSYTMTAEFMGETSSESTSDTGTVVKIGNKWYLYEASEY